MSAIRSIAAEPEWAPAPELAAIEAIAVRWSLIAVLALVAAISLGGVLSLPLAEPDEARYAETARLMFESGDWIVPQLGSAVFLDKPPLLYWLSALSFHFFGVGDASARLPIFLAALGCLAVTFEFSRRLFGSSTAWLSVTLLASCPLFFGLAELLTMDMLLTFWTMAGMAAVWFAIQGENPAWVRFTYLVSAFGVLTKGPIAVVLIWCPAILFLSWHKQLAMVRRLWDWRGLALFALLCAPWFLLVETRQPGFIANFLWHHHVERFVAPWHHREPVWFFAPVLIVGLLPWSVLWLLDPRRSWSEIVSLSRLSAGAYLFFCAACPLIVFSMSSSKLIPYVLPSVPPLAIALGVVYRRHLDTAATTFLPRAGGLVAISGFVALACGLLFVVWVPHWRVPTLRPLLLFGGCALMATGLMVRFLAARGSSIDALAALLVSVAVLLLMIQTGRGELAGNFRELASIVREELPAATKVISAVGYQPGIDFYLGRQIETVESGAVEHLRNSWDGSGPVAVLVSSSDVERVMSVLRGGKIVGRQRHSVLVFNGGS